MTRFLIVVFSVMLITASLIGLSLHEPEMASIIGISKTWVLARLLLAFLLLAYARIIMLRRSIPQAIMRLMGLVLLYGGLSSLLMGSYSSGMFLPAVDIVLAIEGGIVFLLASFELPLQQPQPLVANPGIRLAAIRFLQKSAAKPNATPQASTN